MEVMNFLKVRRWDILVGLELAQYNIFKHTNTMDVVNWIYCKVLNNEKQTSLFGLGDLSTVEYPSGGTLLVTTCVPNKFGKIFHWVLIKCC